MQRIAVFVYSIFAYAVALVALGSLVAFLGNAPWPRPIDGGGVASPLDPALALAVNIGLILLFGVPHSVMARPGFKRWLTRFIPPAAERSTFVWVNSGFLLAMIWGWQPMPTVLWQLDGTTQTIVWGFFGLGWLVLLVATFLVNHFHLFGLSQGWSGLHGADAPEPEFRTPMLYKYVRHPLMTGMLISLWAAPVMSAGHLVASVGLSLYILIGVYFEERDLIRTFGQTYLDYKSRVPSVVPWFSVRPRLESTNR